jgi:hypothetical protein
MRSCAGSRPCREDERDGFGQRDGQKQKRRGRSDEGTGMDDSLTERTIRLAVMERCLAMRGHLRRGGFDDAAEALRCVMDMRLGDIGLQREGEYGNEHDEAPRRTCAPDSRRFRCRSRHEPAIARIGWIYAASGPIPQPDAAGARNPK